MAVVDQYCRVHGLSHLRVIDASAMPEIPPRQYECHDHYAGRARR